MKKYLYKINIIFEIIDKNNSKTMKFKKNNIDLLL